MTTWRGGRGGGEGGKEEGREGGREEKMRMCWGVEQ